MEPSFISPAIIEAIGKVSVEIIAIIVLSVIVYVQMKIFSGFSKSNEKLSKNVDLNNQLTASLLKTVKRNKCKAKDLALSRCKNNRLSRSAA